MLDTCLFQFLLSIFKVNGRHHAFVRVLALGVVKYLDVFEDVLPCSRHGTAAVGFVERFFLPLLVASKVGM